MPNKKWTAGFAPCGLSQVGCLSMLLPPCPARARSPVELLTNQNGRPKISGAGRAGPPPSAPKYPLLPNPTGLVHHDLAYRGSEFTSFSQRVINRLRSALAPYFA